MQTTLAVIVELHRALVTNYKAELARLPIKPKTREILADGFADGARNGIRSALEMIGCKIVDTTPPEASTDKAGA